MMGGDRHMLPDLSGVPHLHVNSPLELISTKIAIISKIEGGGMKAFSHADLV